MHNPTIHRFQQCIFTSHILVQMHTKPQIHLNDAIKTLTLMNTTPNPSELPYQHHHARKTHHHQQFNNMSQLPPVHQSLPTMHFQLPTCTKHLQTSFKTTSYTSNSQTAESPDSYHAFSTSHISPTHSFQWILNL